MISHTPIATIPHFAKLLSLEQADRLGETKIDRLSQELNPDMRTLDSCQLLAAFAAAIIDDLSAASSFHSSSEAMSSCAADLTRLICTFHDSIPCDNLVLKESTILDER